MSKIKTAYFCQNCGHQSPKWLGKCPSCNQWNTIVEEIVKKETKNTNTFVSSSPSPIKINEITDSSDIRMPSNNIELDRVLGGGIVPGAIILVGGEPGIGKSTLLLQVALQLTDLKILYVSGEENEQQIKMRANRIGINNENCFVLTETNTESIFHLISDIQPDLLVIDSIQTLHTSTIESTAGSVSQIRECASQLQKYAKSASVPVFLIGHITKDGNIAGPKILEHMVDVVLNFEGDINHAYRILRASKNRFGSVSEIGIYEMQSFGLREVNNPSEILLSRRDENLSGISISATLEGVRPLLIETQALVSTAAYGMPQRVSTGFDQRRLNMLLAVLEKRCGFRLATKDVFLNIAGGIRVDDPAIDLSIVSSILSSNIDAPISSSYCFAAEVGLSGEIRPVGRIEQRISEAIKLGFEKIFISKYNIKDSKEFTSDGFEVVCVSRIEEVFKYLFS
ncbi:MAG: DNA repair protein RadA [Bacteroidota bacterium]